MIYRVDSRMIPEQIESLPLCWICNRSARRYPHIFPVEEILPFSDDRSRRGGLLYVVKSLSGEIFRTMYEKNDQINVRMSFCVLRKPRTKKEASINQSHIDIMSACLSTYPVCRISWGSTDRLHDFLSPSPYPDARDIWRWGRGHLRWEFAHVDVMLCFRFH